jgi:hypothetical protein
MIDINSAMKEGRVYIAVGDRQMQPPIEARSIRRLGETRRSILIEVGEDTEKGD